MTVFANDVIRITHNMRHDGVGVVSNVYHFKNISAVNLSENEVLLDVETWLTGLVSELDDFMVDKISFVDYHVYNVTKDTPVGSGASPGTAGHVLTDALPSGVAALITLDTGVKKTIGKKFYGGCAEAQTTDGEWESAMMLILNGLMDYLFDTQTLNLHEWLPGSWNNVLNTFAPFIAGIVRSIPAYQRRRKAGVGI